MVVVVVVVSSSNTSFNIPKRITNTLRIDGKKREDDTGMGLMSNKNTYTE